MNPWDAERICYIKLGEKGRWAKSCFSDGVIRFGFSSGKPEILALTYKNSWDAVREYWISKGKTPQVATSYKNQTKSFFDDVGKTLWITIENGFLYYGFTNGAVASDYDREEFDGAELSSHRKMAAPGWQKVDAKGTELRINDLSGRLTKISGFRGTTFTLGDENCEYLKLRLQGKLSPSILKAEETIKQLTVELSVLIQSLTPQDFELLVQQIFANSGWRQLYATGGTRKTVDLELENPITKDVAFVQVKHETNNNEFLEYKIQKENSYYSRMFYVYSKGNIKVIDDDSITLWNTTKVAEQVIATGLINWLIKKAK
jgi:hypothetical protein